jgi:hypothetical protein
MNQRYDYGHGQDLALGGKIGVDASGGISTRGRGIGGSANISAGIGGDVRLINTSAQSYSDDTQIGRDKNVTTNYSNIAKALSSEEFAKTNNLDSSYSEDLRKNFEKQQSLEQSIAMRREQAVHYSNALSHVQSKDSSWEQDKYHELESKVAKTYGVSTKDAHDMIEHNDSRVTPIRRDMENDMKNEVLSQVSRGQKSLSGERAVQSLNKFSAQHQQSINNDPTVGVKERTKNSGLKTDSKHLDSGGLEQKVSTIIQGNQDKITEASADHGRQEGIRQEKINKLEADRIGQGRIAKKLGIGGETNPSTIDHADDGSMQKAEQIVDKKK